MELTRFVESGTLIEPKNVNGSIWRIVVIEEGLSNNGNLYEESCLRQSIGVFHNLSVRKYNFDPRKRGDRFHHDHVPEEIYTAVGILTGNNVGFIRDCAIEKVYSPRQKKMVWGITADFHVTNEDFREELFKTWKAGGIDTSGQERSVYEFSIECEGPHVWVLMNGRRVKNVKVIVKSRELTLVSDGAAGGRVLRIVASSTAEGGHMEDEQATAEEELQEHQDSPAGHQEASVEVTEDGIQKEEFKSTSENEKVVLPEADMAALREAGITKNDLIEAGCALNQAGEILVEESALRESRVRKKLVQGAKELGLSESLDEKTTQAIRKLLADNGYKLENNQLVEMLEEMAEEEAESPEETGGTMAAQSELEKAILLARGGDISGCLDILEELFKNENGKLSESEKESNTSAESSETKGVTEVKSETEDVTESRRTESQQMDSFKAAESPGATPGEITRTHLEGFVADMALRESNMMAALEKSNQTLTALASRLEQSEQKNAEWEQKSRLAESSAMLKDGLANSGLPKSVQAEISTQLEGKIFDREEMSRVIESSRRICTAMVGSVDNGGTSQRSHSGLISIGRCGLDWAKASADRLFGYDWRADSDRLNEAQKDTYRNLPTFTSLRQWFCNWYDDPDCGLGTNGIGPNAILREATSSDLPQLLGDSAYRALMQAYVGQESFWRNIAEVVPVATFKTMRRVRLGGLGVLPIVTESDSAATYLQLGIGADEERTYQVTTKGGLVKLTRTMIINDDINGLQSIPREIGESAMTTLQLNVLACIIANAGGAGINTDTSYDGGVIYSTAHENLTTSPVAYQAVVDALERLSEMRRFANVGTLTNNLNSSDTAFDVSAKLAAALKASTAASDTIRIDSEYMKFVSASGATITVVRGTNGSTAASHTAGARVEQQGAPIQWKNAHLLHPSQLEGEVFSILASALVPGGGNNDASALFPKYQSGRIKPLPLHSMYLGEDRNNWYIVAGKPIEVGFLGGRENPDLLLQDNPLVGDVWTMDNITWKTRHEYGCVMLDHKMAQAGIVA